MRTKVMGDGPSRPMDRNVKARVKWMAMACSRKMASKGKLNGPITRAFQSVLTAMLDLHHSQTGRCFPGWQAIADRAHVSRATVGRALPVLESMGTITWVHRFVRRRIGVMNLVRRTSSAYTFTVCHLDKSQKTTGPSVLKFKTNSQDTKRPDSSVRATIKARAALFGTAEKTRTDILNAIEGMWSAEDLARCAALAAARKTARG